MKWSEYTWAQAEGIYNAILEHPFVIELADGSLPPEKFIFYLGQDAHYLESYFRVLAHIASRLGNKAHAETFIRFASDGIAVEKALHQSFLKGMTLPAKSPTCALYTATEMSTVYESVAVEAASILPCFWVYRNVGRHILKTCRDIGHNPYAQWIETYADEYFDKATDEAIEICDQLAQSVSENERLRMTDIFLTCTRLEWMFWDSAYHLEKWKI